MQSLIYCFDRYIIDPTRHEFWDGDEPVSLKLKVFETLVYLLEHRDRAVGRDELISAVWGRVDVNDSTLNQVITHARHAVGDNAEEQRVIRTIHRHGYGWVLPVEESHVDLTLNGNGAGRTAHANGHSHAAGAASRIHARRAAPDTEPPARRRTPIRWLAPALAATALFAVFALWPEKPDDAPVQARDESALVLPVTVVSDENDSWIRLGLMDLIADRLREAGQSVVPSDNTVALLRDLNSGFDTLDLDAIAGTAAVEVIFGGEAKAVGDHWQVTLQMHYDGHAPIATQGNAPDALTAARMAADHMARRLGYDIPEPVVNGAGDSAVAILLQRLKAEALAGNNDGVRALFESAAPELQADPRIRHELALAEMRDARPAQSRPLFESLVREIDPETDPVFHAYAQYGLGFSIFRQSDFGTAEAHFTRALDTLRESDGYQAQRVRGAALSSRGAARAFLGHHEEALADFNRARIATESTADQLRLISLDSNTGAIYNAIDRPTEAIAYLTRAAERAGVYDQKMSEIYALQSLVSAHLSQLDPEAAGAQLPRMRQLLADSTSERLRVFSSLIMNSALTASGMYTDAEALLESIRHIGGADTIPEMTTGLPTAFARLALSTGDPQRAARESGIALENEWDPASALTQAQTWRLHMRALIALDRTAAAGEALNAAREWLETVVANRSAVQLQIHLMEAELAAATGDQAAARAAFEQALAMAESERVPRHLLDVIETYLPFLIGQGELDRAGVLAGHTAGWSGRHYDAALVPLRLYHAMGDATAWRLALSRAQSLAGERKIPPELLTPPRPQPRLPEPGEPPETALAAMGGSKGKSRP